jgi:hypothetical protein
MTVIGSLSSILGTPVFWLRATTWGRKIKFLGDMAQPVMVVPAPTVSMGSSRWSVPKIPNNVWVTLTVNRQYLDNIRKHSGAFTDDEYESINEEGGQTSEDRIRFHESMQVL